MNSVVGGFGGGGTPGPIPNPEAKPSSADGTALARVWESRSPPTSNAVRMGPRIGGAPFVVPFGRAVCATSSHSAAPTVRRRRRRDRGLSTSPPAVHSSETSAGRAACRVARSIARGTIANRGDARMYETHVTVVGTWSPRRPPATERRHGRRELPGRQQRSAASTAPAGRGSTATALYLDVSCWRSSPRTCIASFEWAIRSSSRGRLLTRNYETRRAAPDGRRARGARRGRRPGPLHGRAHPDRAARLAERASRARRQDRQVRGDRPTASDGRRAADGPAADGDRADGPTAAVAEAAVGA